MLNNNCLLHWGGVKKLLLSDFSRCNTTKDKRLWISFISHYFRDRGFRYVFWLRMCRISNPFVRVTAKVIHRRLSTRFGIQIPVIVPIGAGFRINHGVGIVINEHTIIGENVTFHQFTTVGSWTKEAAKIGDNVTIGPGVCIVDDITIGSNVVIGAGAVVVKDIPNNSVIAGNPARIIKSLS